MLKKRSAQGLSITTIIVAVIGLVIVVVLIAVFTGRIGSFGTELDKSKTCTSVCTSIGKQTIAGGVEDPASCGNDPGERLVGTLDEFSDAPDKYCCCHGALS